MSVRKRGAAKRKPAAGRPENLLDLPAALKPSVPHIETEGNREVVVDGCRGILAYEENLIRLNAGSLILSFRGSELSIQNYSDRQSVITGNIAAIEFGT